MKKTHQFNIYKMADTGFQFIKESIPPTFAALILVLFIPIYILNVVISLVKLKVPLSHATSYDLLGRAYRYYKFEQGVFCHVLLIVLILKKEMTWVGLPRDVDSKGSYANFNIMKVGLVSLYGLHQLTGISVTNIDEDIKLQSQFSWLEKCYLLLRSLLASLAFKHKSKDFKPSLSLFGININNVSLNEAVTKILHPSSISPPQLACFVNVNSINLASNNRSLVSTINDFDLVFADGSGVRIAAQMQGDRLLANVNGTDMLPVLCERASENGKRLFLLGAEQNIARKTAANLKLKYPNLKIVGSHHGYFNKQNSDDVIQKINDAHADVLLVALGSPIQECWLQENRMKLKVNTAIAVGGLFDFYSGRIARAPIWMRELGMEWVWRLMQEPSAKFKRYVIGNPVFLFKCRFLSNNS